MRQFLDIKARYPDALLMFRMGDFYETFFEDAVTAASVLDIALTSRDKDAEDPVPMAGVPYHALGGYLRTLVERGMKVAICEQMESPEEARKRREIVRREVVRVVTPGALVDEEHLRSGEPNFLAALIAERSAEPGGACSVALLDISCGELVVLDADSGPTAQAELVRFAPREILADPALHPWLCDVLGPEAPRLEPVTEPPPKAVARRALALAEEAGVELGPRAALAVATALAYAEATQPGRTLLLHRLRRHEPAAHLVLDEPAVRNLELFRTLRDGARKGSLLWAIDQTQTSMGARTLRAWLGAPCRDLALIRARQDGIGALVEEPGLRAELQSRLKDVRDVIRLAARARLGTATPRELGALRASLAALPGLWTLCAELGQRRTDGRIPSLLDLRGGEAGRGDGAEAGARARGGEPEAAPRPAKGKGGRSGKNGDLSGKNGDLAAPPDLLADLHDDLARTLVDEPPGHGREGGMIREGADPELDEQRRLRDGGREALAAIETRERERTGIPSLKVQHNRVFGYFIEVSKTHLSRVPKDYVRKQTLAGAERYVTEELAGHESKVLGAQAQALAREQVLFGELRTRVSRAGERLCRVGERVAVLDVLAGLAEVAARHDYCRPVLTEEPVLTIEEGRHPVVERMLDAGRFVPNDTRLRAQAGGGTGGPDDARMWLVTGPNMGGKSTVMRQVALIAILAHMGAWVPARSATVGLCDRVFTRVGAADDLGRGDSTFMVEMRETAQILSHASDRSLVLLDEIGRGTATFDGLALAWAIAEFLHDQVGCRTMFATHYHELCALETTLAGVRNVHVTVHEQRGRIVFLHQVEQGPAGRSYGIQVGRLAGLPARVLRRASRILGRLEADPHAAGAPQLDLFTPRAELSDDDPDADEDLDGSGESERGSGESERGSAKSGKGSAKSGRGSAESGRGSAESGRGSAESGKGSAESGKGSAEHGGVPARSADRPAASADRPAASADRPAASTDPSSIAAAPSPAAREVLEMLARLDPDELSPRQAHEQLRRLVERLGRGA
jgi:DNA mismatch repair protein MutS